MTFYHGSAARLSVGDVLVPGEEVGVSYYGRSKHVYMTRTDFIIGRKHRDDDRHVPDEVQTPEQYALFYALQWACWAADVACNGECGWAMDHMESIASAFLPECVHVYVVDPIGEIESDVGFGEPMPEACRTGQAQIIGSLNDRDMATLLDW